MVEHLGLLKNIGQFDCVIGSKMPFSKHTLIYAENGRGKTTLASILRSLSCDDSALINDRHRLGSQDTPHLIIKAQNQNYIFKDGVWSAPLLKIVVFDDNFIAQNVCSGIEIEAGHKQSLHELILGAQGVKLSNFLQKHVADIEEHNRVLREKEIDIPSSIRGGLTLDAFCALPENNKVDVEIQEIERALAAVNSASLIKQQSLFVSLNLPSFDIDTIETLLQRDLPELQTETASSVHQHIANLGGNGEEWIREGMDKLNLVESIEGRDCPFCMQDVSNSNIIGYYENYFSKAYAALQQDITALKAAIFNAHNAEIQSAFERNIRIALQNSEFWQQFMDVPKIEIDTSMIARVWKSAREPILNVLEAKLASPLTKMGLSPEILAAVTEYNRHITNLELWSQKLLEYNQKIALVKERAAVADTATLSADLIKLKAVKTRHSIEYASLCGNYIDEKNAKKETEKLRELAREELNQYRVDIFNEYEQAINLYLRKFNAGFRLSNVNSVNTRGGSSCNYNVLINNIDVPIIAEQGPSFKNTLSAGDRNTLALAFFFASLDKAQNRESKIVVIDDPMTSLDEHRTLATIHEMNALANKVNQVIVLSHSKSFLCQIWDGADKTSRTALKIIRKGESSIIDNWDVTQDSITEHDKRHALIMSYIESSNLCDEREVATALRNILEAFLRVAYPADFPPGTLLGQFHNKCQRAISFGSPILSEKDTVELRQLMDYANKFHHDTNPAYQTMSINDQELVYNCKRILNFAKKE